MRKRASIQFVPTKEMAAPVLKFGGEPFGLSKELWPISRNTSVPMQFICQIPFGPGLFPGTRDSMAYLFMTGGGDEETWLPDGGENSIVILPKDKLTSTLTVGDAPRLSKFVKKWWRKTLSPEPCICSANLSESEDPDFIPEDVRANLKELEGEAYFKAIEGNKLGGTPSFVQSDELPYPEPWHLLLQLDSAFVPFWVNFGDAGIGYAFLNASGTEGKFLWQCC